MMKLLVVLTSALLATSCRDRVDRDDRAPYSKTHETARDDFETTRNTFAKHVNERLEQLDARIHELAAKGTEQARQAADELRAERDRLAPKLDEMKRQAKAGWDQFESDLSKSLDRLEQRIDAAFSD